MSLDGRKQCPALEVKEMSWGSDKAEIIAMTIACGGCLHCTPNTDESQDIKNEIARICNWYGELCEKEGVLCHISYGDGEDWQKKLGLMQHCMAMAIATPSKETL